MEKIQELKQFIVQVCTEKMNMDAPGEIDETAAVEAAYNLDSISMFELIVNLEEKYGLKVPDADIEKIGKMNVAELCAYLTGQTVGHE
ncbi:acyl carrier protein [Paenibacillus athensensis]|nr:acyl carrier protein [Paenibacillus athensensis]